VGPPPDIPIPKAKVYERKSSNSIVATLEGLLEKANAQLDKLQNVEATAIQNYELLKNSLVDGLEITKKDMTDAKGSLPEKVEAKSVATGDLEATSKDLAGDIAGKEALHHECLNAAQEFQASVLSRNTEMNALAGAKKAIQETTGGAAAQTYVVAGASFVQRASATKHMGTGVAKFEAVRFIRDLGARLGSANLDQLASRMSSALQFGSAADPYAKVKDLLANMIMQLQGEQDNDAALKVYCDKEMSATLDKKEDSTSERDRLNTHMEQKRARSAKLRGDIANLQHELAALSKAQAEASQIRQDEHQTFKKDKLEMEQGLRGIKLALRILKEHYGQDTQSNLLTAGASGGIIGLLEVVESDFTKGLAELIVAEETAASYYESTVKPSSELEAATKEHDMKLKTKEYASVNKAGADLENDASHVAEKLAAINQYEAMLKSKCVKPDSYEERKDRRDKELAGLKEALTSLAGETLLLQLDSTQRHTLRGTRRHLG